MRPHLVILGMERSGTSAVGDVILQTRQGVWLGEVWNPNRAWIPKKYVSEVLEVVREPGLDAENLNSFTQASPGKFLSLVQNAEFMPDKGFISSKLLWGQLTPKVIESEVLSRSEVTAICIVRDPFSTFISATKARQSQRWRGLDYTDLRPDLLFEDWSEWLGNRRQFIDFIKTNHSMISGVIFYEKLLTRGSLDPAKLAKALLALSGLPVDANFPNLSRQDQIAGYKKRVKKRGEFSKHLRRTGLRPNYSREIREIRRALQP